eukprot:gene16158-7522_t
MVLGWNPAMSKCLAGMSGGEKNMECAMAKVYFVSVQYGAGGFGSRDYRQYQNRGNQNQGGYRSGHDGSQGYGGSRAGFGFGGGGGGGGGGFNNFVQQNHHFSRGPPPNARPAADDWFDN